MIRTAFGVLSLVHCVNAYTYVELRTYVHVNFCVISEYSVCVLCFLQAKEAMSNNGSRYLREPWEATGSRVTSIPLAPKDSFKIHTVICSTFLPQNGRLFLEPHSNAVCT